MKESGGRTPHPSFFEGWDSTDVSRWGFLATPGVRDKKAGPSTAPSLALRLRSG